MAVSFRDLIKPAAVDDVESAKRRQALAEAMYQRSMTPNVPAPGGPVQAKYGVGNALVDLANSLAGAWNLKQANEGVRGAENARAAALTEATKQLQGAVPDSEVGRTAAGRIMAAPDGQLAEPVYGESESQRKVAGALGPGGPQALAEALLKQSLSRSDPELLASMDLKRATLEGQRADRAAALDERRAAREQRITEIQMRLEDARLAREDRAALMRELAQLRADTATGIAGMRGDAAAAEAQRKAEEKAAAKAAPIEAGKKQVDDVIATLSSYYDTLDAGGGIVNPDRGPLDNLAARVASSSVGQTVGGALGTDNQSARNSIKQTRPILLQAIKNATGMSAQQMNSNVELKLWLEAATDPTLDVRANREALANLQRWLGGGTPPAGGASPGLPGTPATPPAGGAPAAPQTPMQPPGGAPPQPRVFASEDEVAAAGLPDGTPVIVNGVRGTWRNN